MARARNSPASTAKPESQPLLGAHVSTAGGVDKAIDRAKLIGATVMQIFVKNNMQWFARSPINPAELRAFHEHVERGRLRSVFGHTGYMINLAASNPEFLEKSRLALREELLRADALRLPFLVLHPGAHMGAGDKAGLAKVVASLDSIWDEIPQVKTRIALENTAGQGSCLGCEFPHLAAIIGQVREPDRLCVCIDTAHLFASGYDITTAERVETVFREFDRIVGKKRLAALHLNDSKTALGSRVDRHEHIGKGKIGIEAFRYIMSAPRFARIPKVLETPKGKEMREDIENLQVLRALIGE
jgi:deoxyribonuclease-4